MKRAGRIGMVFGVFDYLHEGHKYFLSQAESQCDQLTVAVAPDSVVRELKHKAPGQSLEERMHALTLWNRGLNVRAGDERPGAWSAIREERPDVIFLGYDQQALQPELEQFGIPIVIVNAHQPHKYKSSLSAQ